MEAHIQICGNDPFPTLAFHKSYFVFKAIQIIYNNFKVYGLNFMKPSDSKKYRWKKYVLLCGKQEIAHICYYPNLNVQLSSLYCDPIRVQIYLFLFGNTN